MPLAADINVGMFRFKSGTIETIAAGVITIGQSAVIVAAQSGTADDLDTINLDTTLILPAGYGDMLILKADAGDTITIRDAIDNIVTNSGNNFAISGGIMALLFRMSAADDWTCING